MIAYMSHVLAIAEGGGGGEGGVARNDLISHIEVLRVEFWYGGGVGRVAVEVGIAHHISNLGTKKLDEVYRMAAFRAFCR